jgi:hypothetical protein
MLALIQCEMRGIQPGPINTFPGWKALGRHVLKGQKTISLVMPITGKKRDEENQQAADAADSHDSRKSECFTRFVFRPNWFVLSQTEGNDRDRAELECRAGAFHPWNYSRGVYDDERQRPGIRSTRKANCHQSRCCPASQNNVP